MLWKYILLIIISTLAYANAPEHLEQRLKHSLGDQYQEISLYSKQHIKKHSLKLNKLLDQHQKNNKLEVDRKIASYQKQRQIYLVQAIKAELNSNLAKEKESARSPASANQAKAQKWRLKFDQVDQFAGLIFFKKGELAQKCASFAQQSKEMGFKGIAFFYPVHFSGGNLDNYQMPVIPKYGHHYQFEHYVAPTHNEIEECLKLINKLKLKLHYVPHLESIRTLNSHGDGDWRLLSGIPLDDHYLQAAFGPLIRFLHRNPNAFKKDPLLITLAAEVDPIALTSPENLLQLKNKLEQNLNKTRKLKFFLNTNGDFYNGWNMRQVANKKVNCQKLNQLFKELSALSPSIYGDKGHIAFNQLGLVDYQATKKQYQTKLKQKLSHLCPKNTPRFEHLKVNLGEFALDLNDNKQKYEHFFKSIKKNQVDFIQYWNHSIWDHIGLDTNVGIDTKKLLLTPD